MTALRILLAALGATSLVACGTDPEPDESLGIQTADTGETAGLMAVPDSVLADLERGQSTRVIVRIRKRALRQFDADPPDGTEVVQAYRSFPVRVLELHDVDTARNLLGRIDILAIDADEQHQHQLASSLAHIRQPAVANLGYTGAGTSVAVLDSGVDYTHADLGSCTGVGSPSTCRVSFATDFAPDDGKLDDRGRHGTNVAAIIAAVAPQTDILALDVFDGNGASSADILAAFDWVIANRTTYNIAAMNMSLGHGGFTSTCTGTAFDAAVQAARDAGVAVVVASGNDGFVNGISSPACVPGSFSVGAVHDTAGGAHCTGGSIAPDSVACFSNSASFLDILAPGVEIAGGGVTLSGTSMATPHVAGALAVLRGTDPAATVAQLEQRLLDGGVMVTDLRNGLAFPRLDLAASVDGARCSISVSPGSLSPGAGGESGSLTVYTDEGCPWAVASSSPWLTLTPTSGEGPGSVAWTAAPNTGDPRSATLDFSDVVVTATQASSSGQSGGLLINGGDVATRDTTVTLALNAPGATYMCISNEGASCTRFRAYEIAATWKVKGGSGERTVTAWFADAQGNIGEPVSDSILLDRGKPEDGTVVATGSTSGVTLSWDGFSDALTEVVSYRVVQAVGRRGPRNGCRDTPIYTGAATSLTLTELTHGERHNWRVCALDEAGNLSSGGTAYLVPKPEYDGPDGAILLDGGAAYTSSRIVFASLSATDAHQVTKACVSTKDRCTKWFTMSDTVSVRLASRPDAQTVYAWFEDEHGNTSGPFSDSITVDEVAPIDGSLTSSAGDGSVTLSVAGFSDADSGVAGYFVAMTEGDRAPRRCEGEPASFGPDTEISLTGLTNGVDYSFRVCAIDAVGNASKGVITTAAPVPETVAPVGSVIINDDAPGTSSRRVTLALQATDASGVTRMCVSASETCTKWTDYAESASMNLTRGEGTRTVQAWFADRWGNISEPVLDTIEMDDQAPRDGTVTWGNAALLSWSGFEDLGSGIETYQVRIRPGSPPSCRSGTVVYEGSDTSVTVTGTQSNQEYGFRVCARDHFGNVSRGATTTTAE